ncbi:hypothetical protein [Deinococcus enclensis]|uniref:Uncharacterized protein n=1 Tax=Deinococcus enclensis TaxID=1049582 RepID=A0ABT9MJ78_9DEIO|nr:hypothetical protein [Deinococcus enclensis]MDP9766650.1 hypothetical protein [Deinococcus enclensis]
MNLPQLLIDALVAEIKTVLPDHKVEAREPAESELAANETVRQVFVTTEGLEPGEEFANQGESTQLLIPVFVSCVMPRPGTVVFAAQTLRRRLKLIQAVQRVIRDFTHAHPMADLTWIQERPSLVETFYVSIQALYRTSSS